MKRFLKNNDLEVDITPKVFRRSMNSYFQEKGVPLTIAQQLLGHSNPQMTATAYTFHKVNTIKEAVEKVI
jgi:integrase